MKYLFYIIFSLLLIGISVSEYFVKKRKYIYIMVAAVLALFSLLASLRGENVGLDTRGYSNLYSEVKNETNFLKYLSTHKPEFLFYGNVYLFSKILHLPEIVFRLVMYLGISSALFFSFYKEDRACSKLSIFFFLGFFIMSFSGFRQSISISLATLAISFIYKSYNKRNIIIYYCLIFIGFLFHKSCIVFAILPILMLIKVTYKSYLFLLPLLIFVPTLFSSMLIVVSQYVYVYYTVSNNRVSITMLLVLFLLIIFYFINSFKPTTSFLRRKIKFYSFFDDECLFSNVFWIVYIFLIFTSCNTFSTVVPRYAMYCYFGVSYFIDMFISPIKNVKLQIIVDCIVLMFFALYFIFSTPSLGLVPYSFFR